MNFGLELNFSFCDGIIMVNLETACGILWFLFLHCKLQVTLYTYSVCVENIHHVHHSLSAAACILPHDTSNHCFKCLILIFV